MSGLPDRAAVLPRVFQANLSRLFERVIRPAMDALPLHEALIVGEAGNVDEFLDRAAAQVDNHTANEAAKAIALVLAAVFERQLSIFARAIHGDAPGRRARRAGFEDLLAICACHAAVELETEEIAGDLRQLLIVGNVLRHGDGPACERLLAASPELWDETAQDYYDLAPGPTPASEQLRIRSQDLDRFHYATARFWGLLDPSPMAIANPPVRRPEDAGPSA